MVSSPKEAHRWQPPEASARNRSGESPSAPLHGFLASGHGSRALALVGGPGIGKTTLWEAGIAEAEERGIRVLSTRASGAEAQLSFAALIDLLDRVEEDELAGLPGPQLRALEVALVRAEPDGEPPEPRAIALGFLNALRAVAARGPLLVAIDDAQWLDSRSADVLAFSARRLEDDAIGFLLAERPGSASRFEQALERGGIERLEIDPLNLGAIRHLLSERLGLSLPRQLLRQIVDSTLGNPLFAIELGRTLAREGLPAAGEALPMPEKLEGMLGTRVAHLPGPTRELLLAVSLSADLTTSQLRQIVDTAVVEDALHAGLVLVEGERVRVSHPLLAAAARKHARLDAQRDLHARLAEVIGDDELRAWHLALATERPDGDLATMVATAAGRTAARGAAPEAVELARHALRLTPTEAGERSERLLALGGYMDVAGEQGELVQLLAPEIDSLPAGEARAKACMLVCEGLKGFDEAKPFYDRALAESESDPKLHAVILAQILSDRAVVGVERIREAEAVGAGGVAGRAQRGTGGRAGHVVRPRLGAQPARATDRRDLRALPGSIRDRVLHRRFAGARRGSAARLAGRARVGAGRLHTARVHG